jgi:hypothetical protein
VRQLLVQASEIAKKRNEIVHAMALSQVDGQKFKARHKGVDKEYDPVEIHRLAQTIAQLWDVLVETSTALAVAVDEARQATQ